jgi:hypothetical protein
LDHIFREVFVYFPHSFDPIAAEAKVLYEAGLKYTKSLFKVQVQHGLERLEFSPHIMLKIVLFIRATKNKMTVMMMRPRYSKIIYFAAPFYFPFISKFTENVRFEAVQDVEGSTGDKSKARDVTLALALNAAQVCETKVQNHVWNDRRN